MSGKKHLAKEEKGPLKKEPESEKQGKKPIKKELAEIKETLQRVQAEFENSRKRLDREKEEFAKIAAAALVAELLPLLDSIEAAEKALNEQQQVTKEKAIEGIELIKRQLLAILGSAGLKEIKALGQKFDPMLHDCVMKASEKGKEEDIVLEELQKGYMLNGKVLRHAKVKVNKL